MGWSPTGRQALGRPVLFTGSANGAFVAWMDPQLTKLAVVPGTGDPLGSPWGGQVSPSQQPFLVSSFNGGFKWGDFDGGVIAFGASYRSPVAGQASLIAYDDGTYNVGASGIIMMSQAIRLSGRVPLPVPRAALWAVDSLRRATRYTELDREQLDYLSYGRVMDTLRMRNDLGYSPKWTTAEAFDDYVRGRGLTPIIDPRWVRSVESRAVSAAQRWGR